MEREGRGKRYERKGREKKRGGVEGKVVEKRGKKT